MTPLPMLLVEDNEDSRGLVVRLLEDLDTELLQATDGQSALALARVECPVLILLDMSIPLLDGWEVARRLKRDPGTAHIPVVAITAHAMRGDEERARAAGCDGFVTKPIESRSFRRLVEFYLKQAADAS